MSRLYNHKTKGLYLHSGECTIPELKKDGVILRHNDNKQIIAISNDMLKEKFQLIKKIKVEEIE